MAIGPLSPRESPQPSTASRCRIGICYQPNSARLDEGVCRQPRMNHDDVCRMRGPGTKHHVAACTALLSHRAASIEVRSLAALPCYSRLVLLLSSCRPQRAVIHTMIREKRTPYSLVTTAVSHTTSDARPTHGPIRHFLPGWHGMMRCTTSHRQQSRKVTFARLES